MDPTKANLNSSDDGGQYDIKAPKGASCAGWDYFVNLIEPSGKDYCIRCCVSQKIIIHKAYSIFISTFSFIE
jgi:pyruvate-formate lyase